MDRAAWPSGPYGEVYQAVHASIAPSAGHVAPGIDAKIGHMIDFLRAEGDRNALKILEAISVNIERVRHQARSNERPAGAGVRAELARLTEDWLAAAPMFAVQQKAVHPD